MQTRGRIATIVAVCCLVLLSVAAYLLASHWPFTQQAVERSLERSLHARVTIGRLHQRFFPHPGCVVEQIHAVNDGFTLDVERLTAQGSYVSFLTGKHELDRVAVEGGIVHFRSRDGQQGGDVQTLVREFVIDRSIFERVATKPQDQPLRIEIHHATIHRSEKQGPIQAEGTAHYPKPDGELWARVHIDKLSGADTPLSGEYRFEHAHLGVFNGIAGTLTSRGKFSGPLRQVAIDGTTDAPDFEVTHSDHPVKVSASFHAVVDGTNGDTALQPVETAFGQTRIRWTGDIRGDNGKTAALEMVAEKARIQDLLYLVLHSDRPSMDGPIDFRAHVVLPPEDVKFIERLQLDGDFGIHGQFTNPNARRNVDQLSERARGEKDKFDNPEDVLNDLRGHVHLRRGTAHLTNLSFRVPGALAQLAGTYNLVTHRIDLHGHLKTEASLSNNTKGVKSFLLKAVDPFFKRKDAGADIPVSITGVYPHPVYSALGMHKGGSKSN